MKQKELYRVRGMDKLPGLYTKHVKSLPAYGVCTIGFTYRFGKTSKSAARQSAGAADEMERVGTGN